VKLRKVVTILLVICMVLGLAACGNNSASNTSTDNTASAEKQEAKSGENASSKEEAKSEGRRFGIIYPIIHPFFEPVGEDAEEYAATKGWTVIANGPSTSNAQEQIEIMENMISMGLDGIAIGPTDSTALRETIDKAVDKGIKVITMESDCEGSKRYGYIGTDNYKAGRHMGSVIGEKLNGEGEIMILTGLPTQESLNLRIKGIQDYLAEHYPNIKIVDTQASEGDATKAVELTENMIQANPDFKAIIGIDATAGPAMVSVWKAKGWQNSKEHMIITFDDMPDNLKGMEDGYITAIVAQRESSWGKGVLDMMNDLCDGKEIPDYTDTGTVEIRLDNLKTYTEEPSWVEK
jgi:ribose transport system substrate-binding protein